jgi:hypothetical protein
MLTSLLEIISVDLDVIYQLLFICSVFVRYWIKNVSIMEQYIVICRFWEGLFSREERTILQDSH